MNSNLSPFGWTPLAATSTSNTLVRARLWRIQWMVIANDSMPRHGTLSVKACQGKLAGLVVPNQNSLVGLGTFNLDFVKYFVLKKLVTSHDGTTPVCPTYHFHCLLVVHQ